MSQVNCRSGIDLSPVTFLTSWRCTHSDVMVTTCTSIISLPAKRRNTGKFLNNNKKYIYIFTDLISHQIFFWLTIQFRFKQTSVTWFQQ